MALPLIVVATGMLVLAVVLGIGLVNAKKLSNAFRSEQSAYMADVQRRLALWYKSNVGLEADPNYSISSDDLFAAASIYRRYGVQLVISPQLNDGTVSYHKIAVVAPGTVSSGTLVSGYGTYAADGTFSAPAGFSVLEYDGKMLQYQALSSTNKALEQMASALEQYATARMQSDENSDGANNYFLPASACSIVSPVDFPCTGGVVDAGTFLQAPALLGIGSGLTTQNAWGTAITLDNDIADNSAQPPYTMTVTTVTPWNSTLSVKAVQPLY
jgi:Tfp pilus assembly protein PilV